MIEGDIDLTEKLDFYRDKEKKESNNKYYRKALPWRKEKNQESISIISNLDPWSRSISYYTNIPAAITWTTLNNNISFDNYTSIINAPITSSNTNYTTFYTTTYSTINNNYTGNIRWIDENSGVIEYDSIWNDDITIEEVNNLENEDYYIPLFGKPKKPKYKSPMVYNTRCGCKRTLGRCKHYKEPKSDAFKNIRRRKQSLHEFTIGSYREYHNFIERFKGKPNNSRKARIPWLSKLKSWMYDDYMKDLFSEQDYSSYLTNMGWLRIHR